MLALVVALFAGVAPPARGDGSLRPTIVLVHGAWADTSSWNGEVSALRQHGYDAHAIANPLQNLTTDAASVTDFLRTIPSPIVLVGHSYGGSVRPWNWLCTRSRGADALRSLRFGSSQMGPCRTVARGSRYLPSFCSRR
jgi:alpha-beta hydrolase superfamily lysophospholipase